MLACKLKGVRHQVHYGRASLSPLSRLPAYFVFTRARLDSGRAAQHVVEWATGRGRSAAQGKRALLVLPDLPLVWAVARLRASLADAAAQVGRLSCACEHLLMYTARLRGPCEARLLQRLHD